MARNTLRVRCGIPRTRDLAGYHPAPRKSSLRLCHYQFEILIDSAWYAVVRYDTAHGRPHRDILHPNGDQTKEWFEGYSVADVLTIGQRDVLKNWGAYRSRFLKEMKK
ncbi:MAG: DUF7718 family protein [Chloroflexota bacterium]